MSAFKSIKQGLEEANQYADGKRPYSFKIVIELPADDLDTDEIIEALAEAGCTDALVGTGVRGRISLEFDRMAENNQVALYLALADIFKAIPSARVVDFSRGGEP